jgi:hypothetical protein
MSEAWAEPKVTAVRVNFGGGGKVALAPYSAITSDYHVSISRDYVIPEVWTDEEVAAFELEKIAEIRAQVDPILDREFEERWNQRRD